MLLTLELHLLVVGHLSYLSYIDQRVFTLI